MTRWSITGGGLTQAQVAGVLGLAEAAEAADGVAPLSEHGLLHLRYDAADPGPASERYSEPASEHGPFRAGCGGGRPPVASTEPVRAVGASQHGGNRDVDLTNANSRVKHRDLVLTVHDEIAGYAHLDPDAAGPGLSGELVIHPGRRRQGLGLALVREVTAEAGGRPVRLWAHGDLPAAAGLAGAAGFDRVRALWQMRRPLRDPLDQPGFPAGITARTFRPGQDEDEWLSLNGRAFANHPEQGAWTRHDLELREREPWFDPAGFFIAERDGAMAGFHWTKVPDAAGGMGEVYIVGVDPAEQGTGLGRALTLAGLHHLRDRGLAQVTLYVDEDNVPAIRMYRALGFTRWRTDAMYGAPRRG